MSSLKPDFSSQSLKGRADEIAQLQQLFDAVQSEKQSRSVFLHGYSGTGKSRLATCALEEYAATKRGYFCMGKYDQQLTGSVPYSAIVQACTDVCQWITTNDRKEIQFKLLETISGESHASFRHAVPAFPALLDESYLSDSEEESSAANFVPGAMVFEQLKQSFLAFFRVICDDIPLVLHLDDIQWADALSLEILQRLQQADVLHQMLFVCSYRDNEVDQHHPLYESIRKLEGHNKAARIHVGDLSREGVNELVAQALQRSHDRTSTQELSDAVHHKTNGNAFFTVQLLELLYKSEMLKFSFRSMCWEWDMNKIRSETNSSDNVVDMVVRKIKNLPSKTALALSIAACLGSRFDAQVMELILEKWSETSDRRKTWASGRLTATESPLEALQPAIDERLIDPLAEVGHYKFSHDRIQQAASARISDEHERKLLHLRIGNLLWRLYRQEGRSRLLLVTVDQLGRASDLISNPDTRIELVRLYLQASHHVRRKSAFIPAAKWLRQGIELLGDNKWAENYDLSLEMHTLAAQTEFSCGNFELCRDWSGAVLVHATSLADKLPAHHTIINCYAAEGQWEEVYDMAHIAAAQGGERLPKNPGKHQVVWELILVKRAINRLSDDDILQLPYCTVTKERHTAWKIIAELTNYSWQSDRKNDFAVRIARLVRRMVEEGLCEFSAFYVALYSLLISTMGDIGKGYRFAKLALILQKRLETKFEDAKRYAAHTCIGAQHAYAFRHPIDQVLDLNFHEVYQRGMEAGAINWALLGLMNHLIHFFCAGLPMDVILQDSPAFLSELADYKQQYALFSAQVYRQCFLNLAGESDHTALLQGEAVAGAEMDTILGENNADIDNRFVQIASFAQLMLAYHFQDYDLAMNMADLHASFGDSEWPMFWTYLQPFYRSLANLAAFKRDKTRKRYLKHADKDMKRVHWFCQNGMLNCAHLFSILKAERLSVVTPHDSDAVRSAYNAAIVSTRKVGNIRDTALVCERAGLYFLDKDERDDYQHYLTQAMDYYGEWGAEAKIRDIHVYSGLDEELGIQAVSLKGKSRKAVSTTNRRYSQIVSL